MGGCLSSIGAAKGGSSESNHRGRSNTATVISANGELHQYTIPISVSQLLEMEYPTKTPAAKFFVCNSDRLYYDDYIPPLDAEDELQVNQIYFVLPVSKLQYRLTASDMAALAVKASLALQKSTSNNSSSHSKKHSSSSFFIRNRGHGRRGSNKSARISPILVDHVNGSSNSSSSSSSSSSSDGDHDGDYKDENHRNEQTVTTTIKKGISVDPNKQKPAAAAAAASLVVSKSGSVRKLQRYSSKRAKMAVRSFRIRLTTIYEEASVLQFY